MDEILIRYGEEKDINGIRFLGGNVEELKGSECHEFYGKDELREWINKPEENIIIVAVKGDLIVGFLYARLLSRHWCMIDSVCVMEEYRGFRLGSRLFETLEKILSGNSLRQK